ncbi:hypothetical protein NEMBOFW57_006304 [Staphylotrichum longicolle]|uniref:Uncharacterized protein n=1 Tax=Staphylotrichum longicolle TaxID=669026 RepID=A0AAD4F1U0_9PEZI|nr:hypothetical protein NEMBOFW57_006304 [Staphylotrichum longicolle]
MTELENSDSEESDALQTVMAKVDPKTDVLHLKGAVPTNDQWEALAQHFTNVRFLKVATGWDEDWIDDKFPLNWPLELLIIADASGERVRTPAILQGRIKHLVLFYNSGLRFEGPTIDELMKDAEQLQFLPRQQKTPDAAESESPAAAEDTEPATEPPNPDEAEPDGIRVYSVPHEWHKWICNKYATQDLELSLEPKDGEPPSAMRSLQILGNDALQMFSYMALANFHLLYSLSSLAIDSPDGNDLSHIPPNIPLIALQELQHLKNLKLTLGSPVYATLLELFNNEPFLHAVLPPNIETLQLRGPVSMAPHLDEFAAGFEHAEFLPNLKRITLVLDKPDQGSDSPSEASLEQLRAACKACKKVLDAARSARGVVVEAWREPWVEEHSGLFHAVDDRWAVLEEIESRG